MTDPVPLSSKRSNAHAAQLNESERKLALLVSSVKDYGIFMLDQDGSIATWNEGAQNITGYPESEALGKHFSVFYTPEAILSQVPQHELEVARKQGRLEEEGFRVRKGSGRFWANIVITPIFDDGQLIGFANVVRDLTERRTAERNEAKLQEHMRLMIDSVRDYAIFMLDAQGNVMTWNEGAERINGFKAQEIIGRHFSSFYTQESKDIGHPQKELEIAKAQGRYEEEGWRVRKDGSMFWANVVITALFEHGELVGFAKVTRDLTERKRLEELKEENARQLEATNKELQRLSYVVSHELQAPVSTIVRYGNLLTARYRHLLGADAVEFFDRITYSTQLISRMVDDLWSYARLSRPNQQFETVYVPHAVSDALDQLKGQLTDAQITVGALPSVEAVRPQLALLFKELLKNAIRYCSSATPVVQIGAVREEDGWRFFVKDNGIGLDRIHATEVFQLFHRLSAGPEPTATGMGLASCKRIVEQHHGQIWYDSQPGKGTTFNFWLPEKQARAQA